MSKPREILGECLNAKMCWRIAAVFLILACCLQNPLFSQNVPQIKITYDVFDKSPLDGIKIDPLPVMVNNRIIGGSLYPNQQNAGLRPHDYNSYDHDRDVLEWQQDQIRQRQIEADIKNDIANFGKHPNEAIEKSLMAQEYQQAFSRMLHLDPDHFSVIQAIYTVEHAYMNDKLSFEEFAKAIGQRATLVKQILQREGLNPKNDMALNYGIQKLFSQTNDYYDSVSKRVFQIPPIKYDFQDYRGDSDYTKMFVTKTLRHGSGQCHSMPLLYLAIAEALGAKAWLSLAPQHSFIQFKDNQNNLVNFETTNGHIVSSTWLTQSGYINAMAMQNKTYLDTLSQRELYAQLMGDLLLGYLHKYGYTDFAENIRQEVLTVNPNNLTAKIVDANIKTRAALQTIRAAGKPKEEDLPKYPQAYRAYLNMHDAYAVIDNMGYQDMPKEAYQRWLKSIEQEKQSQRNKAMQEKLRREIQQLKNLKTTFERTPIKQ